MRGKSVKLTRSGLGKYLQLLLILILIATGCTSSEQKIWTDQEITAYWTSGKTLPLEVSAQYPLRPQRLKEDKGFNVLIDMAHQCSFATLWSLPRALNQLGYRAVGSHAVINSVLDPKGQSRIRIDYDIPNKVFPFAWWPNPRFHVVITEQASPESQVYTEDEIKTLVDFVRKGGGLIILGNARKEVPDEEEAKNWSLNKLAQAFGAGFTAETIEADDLNYAVCELDDNWEPMGETTKPILARRAFGKGRVIICGNLNTVRSNRRDPREKRDRIKDMLTGWMEWCCGEQEALSDEARLPQPMSGGGGIYPELEDSFSNIVFYYAANQKEELLKTVQIDIPKAQDFIQQRLPSKATAEPMYLILCAGSGGGWAVNAYRPKENGIISLQPYGIISIFSHELAHTMHGPANENGDVAGITPIPNRGEAHAGWYQGKVNALFKEEIRNQANRNCNSMFDYDVSGNALDLVSHYENEALLKEWGKGKDWIKTWYMWQKIDDRYGPTWYPRWRYVQHTRWREQPDHRLSWDEMVEDMSIAVAEDLFPFIRKLGISVQTERLESIKFAGTTITLPVAPIEVTPAGPVRIEAIGDYKKPLTDLRK